MIAQRLEKQQFIRQERREGFSDDNDTVYAELKRQLGNQTRGDPALPRQMPIDTHIGGLGGLEDSQNPSQETETSLDLSQTSIDWERTFRDSDGSNQGSLDNAGGGRRLSNDQSLMAQPGGFTEWRRWAGGVGGAGGNQWPAGWCEYQRGCLRGGGRCR